MIINYFKIIRDDTIEAIVNYLNLYFNLMFSEYTSLAAPIKSLKLFNYKSTFREEFWNNYIVIGNPNLIINK